MELKVPFFMHGTISKKVMVLPRLTLYLNYYDPRQTRELKHSTALENGRIGSVNFIRIEAKCAK